MTQLFFRDVVCIPIMLLWFLVNFRSKNQTGKLKSESVDLFFSITLFFREGQFRIRKYLLQQKRSRERGERESYIERAHVVKPDNIVSGILIKTRCDG